jgi:hypothetical protein
MDAWFFGTFCDLCKRFYVKYDWSKFLFSKKENRCSVTLMPVSLMSVRVLNLNNI